MSSTGATTHKRFAPSSSKRWLTCIGSTALIEALPQSDRNSPETIHTRRGTCAHAVGELVLYAEDDPLQALEAEDYLGMDIEGVTVDEDIVMAIEYHIDYCRGLILTADKTLIEESDDLVQYIEDYHDLDMFMSVDGDEAGGTSDFAALEKGGTLEIVDYKNGVMLVEHEENTQMMVYALGKYIKYHKKYKFDNVRMTVTQPNAYHEQGEVRSFDITPKELLKWGETVLLPGIEKNLEVVEMLNNGLDIQDYLTPTEEGCVWCPVKATCIKRLNTLMEHGSIDMLTEFDEDGNSFDMMEFRDPMTMSEEQTNLVLHHAKDIIAFVKAVQSRAHSRAETGTAIDGFKLIRKTGHRKIEGEESEVRKALKKMRLSPVDYLTTPVIKSPAQLETAMRKHGVSIDAMQTFAEKYFIKPEIGTSLVPDSHAKMALPATIDDEFGEFYGAEEDEDEFGL